MKGYRKAAGQGYVLAQNNLGVMYKEALSTPWYAGITVALRPRGHSGNPVMH